MLQLIDSLPEVWRVPFYGALIGDALGVPHEFKEGSKVPSFDEIQMVMPSTYPKTYETIPYGTWSDDGSQLLALLDTLTLRQGVYDEALFAQNLLAWYRKGRYQAGGVVFDVGGQTAKALAALERGVTVDDGFTLSRGNGALMRVLPFAALPDLFEVSQKYSVLMAMRQSDLTHPNVHSRVACALYIEMCWQVQAGLRDFGVIPYSAAAKLHQRDVLTRPETFALLDLLAYTEAHMPTGAGFVENSLWSALWAVQQSSSLSDALRHAVGLGNDTDTVACLAGGLAGLAFGMDDLAEKWRGQLVLPAAF